MEENYNYSATVDSVNIELGTFVVNYIPENDLLTPISLNASIIHTKENLVGINQFGQLVIEDNPFSFEDDLINTIKRVAPYTQWRNQYLLLNNFDTLLNYQYSTAV